MKKVLSLFGFGLLVLVGSNTAQAAQCRVELTNPRGRVLEFVIGNEYNRQDACRQALRQCERVKFNGRYARRAHRLTCSVVQPRPVMVSQSCSARVQSRRMVSRVFTATATGPHGSGVKAAACQQALDQCVASLSPRGPRGARVPRTCIADNGATAGGRVIVTPPPRRTVVVTPRGRRTVVTPRRH